MTAASSSSMAVPPTSSGLAVSRSARTTGFSGAGTQRDLLRTLDLNHASLFKLLILPSSEAPPPSNTVSSAQGSRTQLNPSSAILSAMNCAAAVTRCGTKYYLPAPAAGPAR